MGVLDWITPGVGSTLDGLLEFGSSLTANSQQRRFQDRQNEFNANQAELNRRFQSREAEIARDWQEQQYNLYSSPQAMVRQYNDAGLNPALMYGQNLQGSTGSSPSPSGSAASGSTPSAFMANMTGIIQSFLGLAKLKQDINESKSREFANNASAYASERAGLASNASSALSYSQIKLNNASIKRMAVQNEQILYSISNDNKRLVNETRHINAILTQISANNKVSLKQVEQIDAAIKRMSVQNALDQEQKNTLCAQQVLLEFQAEESLMRRHELLSKTRLNNAQANAMSETLYEQRFKNKYLYLYGAYPPPMAASDTFLKWQDSHQKPFEPY